MHWLKFNKIAVSMAVGAAVAATGLPANLNAITSATPYQSQAAEAENTDTETDTSNSEAQAQIVAEAVGEGAAKELKVQEPEPIDIWLEKLAYQESRHRSNIKILDVNGKYSYGCLQFQEGTFRAYALKYGLISRATATESVIYDCDLQKKLAKLMLAENYSNWQAWYTSVTKTSVGMPPRI